MIDGFRASSLKVESSRLRLQEFVCRGLGSIVGLGLRFGIGIPSARIVTKNL